jgi:hypothetical protein
MPTIVSLNESLACLTLPVVHSNGTGQQQLVDSYKSSYRAILAVIERFARIEFNSRDYTNDPDSYVLARESRFAVLCHLRDVEAYFLVHLGCLATTVRFPSEACIERVAKPLHISSLSLPSCGLNGTNKNALFEDYSQTRALLRHSIKVITGMEFNARDYYVSGSDAFTMANIQRQMVFDNLKLVEAYLLAHMEKLS